MKTERISNLSLTTITRFTKEQLIKRLEEQQSGARYALSFVQDSEILRDIEMDLRITEIARASLEAGPVVTFYRDGIEAAATWVDKQRDVYDSEHGRHDPDTGFFEFGNDAQRDYSATLEEIAEGIRRLPPNTVPPAPVVPTFDEWLEIRGNKPLGWVKDAMRESYDACRAAMLQGSQPVSNRDELPATQQPQNAQQNIPNNIPSGLIEAVNDLLNNDGSRGRYSAIGCGNAREKIELWLSQRQKWESQRDKNISAGNSPVIGVDLASGPDRTVEVRYFAPPGYVMVPKRLTAENGAKCLLVGEFSETKFINCTECFGDDECETCDGSGRIEISVPVSWTNIKAIWAKGVEHFAAAPKQETL
ncbi:TPA: hypothetical protein ACGQPR_003715 [Citrobacter amalonaticus]